MSQDWNATDSSADPDMLPPRWGLALTLFLLTVLSTLFIGATTHVGTPYPSAALVNASRGHHWFSVVAIFARWILSGWPYALPLLGILVCHESGHYVACRIHRVPASLPMFIPVPLPPFGTMGAVIRMRERIRERNALLDVGASGPLAGLVVAIPVTAIGLMLSPVRPLERHGMWTQEGTSLVYGLLKLLTKGVIPSGSDVFLHPVAMAGWVGLFVTMINLIPYGQLDGGHVAYAVLGRRHDRLVRWIPAALVALAAVTGIYWGLSLQREHRDPWLFGTGYTQGFNWLIFAGLISLMHRGSGGRHPPTDDDGLSRGRRMVAWVTLAMFVALFMPVPLRAEIFPN